MSDVDAYVITFRGDHGRRYNLWLWPDDNTVEVNVSDGDGWLPLIQADPHVEIQS